MTAVSKEVLAGSMQSKDYKQNVDKVAKNVSRYIDNKSAGHRIYGLGYLISQVMDEVLTPYV